MVMFKKILSVVAMVLSGIAIITAIGLIVGVWILGTGAKQSVDNVFAPINSSIDNINNSLDDINSIIDGTIANVNQFSENITQEGTNLDTPKLNNFINNTLTPKLDQVSATTGTLEDKTAVLRSRVQNIKNLPFINAPNPEASRLQNVETALGNANQSLNQIKTDVANFNQTGSAGKQNIINDINSRLTNLENTLVGIQENIQNLQTNLNNIKNTQNNIIIGVTASEVAGTIILIGFVLAELAVFYLSLNYYKNLNLKRVEVKKETS